MLKITISLASNKSVFTSQGSIKGFGDGNVVGSSNIDDEANKVHTANTGFSISGIRFLISKAKLAFAELSQAFNTALTV